MNIFSEITWSSLLGTLLTNVPHFSGTAIKSFSFLSFCCFCKTFNLKKLSKKKKREKFSCTILFVFVPTWWFLILLSLQKLAKLKLFSFDFNIKTFRYILDVLKGSLTKQKQHIIPKSLDLNFISVREINERIPFP